VLPDIHKPSPLRVESMLPSIKRSYYEESLRVKTAVDSKCGEKQLRVPKLMVLNIVNHPVYGVSIQGKNKNNPESLENPILDIQPFLSVDVRSVVPPKPPVYFVTLCLSHFSLISGSTPGLRF
jgi:hypothetical protein